VNGRTVGSLIAATFPVLLALEAAAAQVPGRCEQPADDGNTPVGCYLLASVPLGELPDEPVYWHLYSFRSAKEAEEMLVRGGTATGAFDRGWLFAIAGSAWRPAGGIRVAVLGPILVVPGRRYTARYITSHLSPGMQTRVHRHPGGPELFYVLEGGQCIETPEGRIVVEQGESPTIPARTPMQLTAYGSRVQRSLGLILHESDKPWVDRSPVAWNPLGLCAADPAQSAIGTE
jgi:quercetin dioxygenase-like cupin family protein